MIHAVLFSKAEDDGAQPSLSISIESDTQGDA